MLCSPAEAPYVAADRVAGDSAPAAPAAIPFTLHVNLRYRSLRRAVVRDGVELSSKRRGRLASGEVITVLQSRDGVPFRGTGGRTTTRLRFARGWVSLTSRSGASLFVMEDNAASAATQLTTVANPMLESTPPPNTKTAARVHVQRTGSAVLRERKDALHNILGNDDADSPLGVRRSGAALYVTNPRFAGEAESSAPSADSDSAPISLEDEELFVDQLRRRLSRLSTTELVESVPARRERLPSLTLGKSVRRPLGQTDSSEPPATPPAESPLGQANAPSSDDKPPSLSPAAEAVASAACTFLESPGGVQICQRAVLVAMEPSNAGSTGAATAGTENVSALAALAELRQTALSVMWQSVHQVSKASEPGSSRERIVSKVTPRKRKRAAGAELEGSGPIRLDQDEQMAVVDAILGVLLPAEAAQSLFNALKESICAPADDLWVRASSRYAGGNPPAPGAPDLAPVVAHLQQMAPRLHTPGIMLRALLTAVRTLYTAFGHEGNSMSADELLPLFITAVAKCDANMGAVQRYVEELGHYSPCGEAARYLTDLSAAVYHILDLDGRAVVAECLRRRGIGEEVVECFLEEGYSGDKCVRELEALGEDELAALVEDLSNE